MSKPSFAARLFTFITLDAPYIHAHPSFGCIRQLLSFQMFEDFILLLPAMDGFFRVVLRN